jgi:hypothetical protein
MIELRFQVTIGGVSGYQARGAEDEELSVYSAVFRLYAANPG